MPRWSGQETSSVAVSAFAGARMARRVRDLRGQKKAPRAGAGGPAAFGAATASALSGRWRWEPASPLPRFREIRLVALGRRHLTRRSTALVHRITSVSAWGTSSGAQTPPPARFPRWSPVPPLSGRPTTADFGRSRTRGRVRSPVLRNLSDARRFDHRGIGTGGPSQELEVDRRGAGGAVGHQGVVGDAPAPLPTLPRVQALGIGGGRVEHEQRLARAERVVLGGREQRRTDAAAASAAEHEHLGEVAAVGLV